MMIDSKIVDCKLELIANWPDSTLRFKGHTLLSKNNENFANYFLKTKANNKCFTLLKCTCKWQQKSIIELER